MPTGGVRYGKAYIEIGPKIADGFDRQLAQGIEEPAKKTRDGVNRALAGLAAGAGIALASKAVGLLGDATAASREAGKVAAQTEAVIKSTGGLANVTSAQVAKLAESISLKTAVDNEAIQQASNLLLTFTNVRNEVGKGNDIFNQATKTVTDMSVALGTDAKGSAIQLGKALNDPIAGVSALAEVGVTFSAQQREQIKNFVEHGDMAKAQGVILAELNKEFGGSAAAQATAADRLNVTLGNLQERIGAALVPIMDKLATTIIRVVEWFDRASPTMKMVVAVAGGLIAAIAAVVQITKAWTAVQAALNVVMSANPIGLVVLAIGALIAGLIVAYNKSDTFRAVVDSAFRGAAKAIGVLADTARTVFDFLSTLFLNFTAAGLLIKHFDTIRDVATSVFDTVRSVASGAFRFIAEHVLNPMIDSINTVIRGINLIKPGDDIDSIPRFDIGPPPAGGSSSASGGGGSLARVEARALGGAMLPGRTYLVGDRHGPELVTMGSNGGTVLTNSETVEVLRGGADGGGGLVVEHLEVKGQERPADTARETVRSLRKLAHLSGLGRAA